MEVKKNKKQINSKFRISIGNGIFVDVYDTSDEVRNFINNLDLSKIKGEANATPNYQESKVKSQDRKTDQSRIEIESIDDLQSLSKIEQVKILIRSLYPPNKDSNHQFTSKDIFSLGEELLGPLILKQSTVSTYLKRLYEEKNILTRIGTKKDYTYTLKSSEFDNIYYFNRVKTDTSKIRNKML